MRICFVANADSIHVQRWIKYSVDRGHDVHLITHSDKVLEGITTHRVKSIGIPDYIAGLIKTSKFIKEIEPDIVHAHYVSRYGIYAALANFHLLMITAWGSDILVDSEKYFGMPRFLIKYALKKADLIHSVAHHLTMKCIRLGADSKKIVTFPITPDLEKFNPNVGPMLGGENIIVSTRALEPVYDVKALIESVPHIIEKIPSTQFVVIGDGSQKGPLERLAKSLSIDSRVKFIGHVSHDDMPGLLTSADVYVSTSLSDGASVSLLEAMACGVFPVVTDIEANRPWVQDGSNGFLVPTKSPRVLAQKIVEALENKEFRSTTRGKNLRVIREHSWLKNMGVLEEEMLKLVERHPT